MESIVYCGPSTIHGQNFLQREIKIDGYGNPIEYRDEGPTWKDKAWTPAKSGSTIESLRPHPEAVMV